MNTMKYDLAIIGGGPAGYAAAERAGKKGLSVVIFEKKELGGVCLNEGCIPTKTLLYSAKLYDQAKNSEKYGVIQTGTRFDLEAMLKRKDKVVKKLVRGVADKMKHAGAAVVKETAVIKGRDGEGIHLSTVSEDYLAANLLICTGSETLIPDIRGLDLSSGNILTSREILSEKTLPRTLAIIGGGVIGMEFASLYNSLGVKVMVIEMLDEILTGMDKELSAMFRAICTKRGIEVHLQARVTEINGNRLLFETGGKSFELTADKILLSAGRRPVIAGLGLEKLGVELREGGIKVDEQMLTNVPNVFAAGDVTGFSLLAHTAYREAGVVVNNLTGRRDIMRYGAIPSVVYTNPELAGVGHTEKSAGEAGIEFKVSQLPMTYAGRFIAENEGETGICKILVGSRHGEIIGVHLLGNPASEMIYGAAMAIESELTLKEMEEMIFPHPTVSEIFRETIFSFQPPNPWKPGLLKA